MTKIPRGVHSKLKIVIHAVTTMMMMLWPAGQPVTQRECIKINPRDLRCALSHRRTTKSRPLTRSLGARREPRDIWSKEMCQKLSAAAATAAYVYFKADDSSGICIESLFAHYDCLLTWRCIFLPAALYPLFRHILSFLTSRDEGVCLVAAGALQLCQSRETPGIISS
jgi:hypothetical protein